MFKVVFRVLFISSIVFSQVSCGGGGGISTSLNGSENNMASRGNGTTTTTSTVPTGNSSLDVVWTIPTENTDGSALMDLKGFKIYYGVSDTSLSQSIFVDNPNVTSYTIDNLASSTRYYFSVTVVNTLGNESIMSNIINTITI